MFNSSLLKNGGGKNPLANIESDSMPELGSSREVPTLDIRGDVIKGSGKLRM